MASKPHPPLMKKHSQTDLISRLKSRKILGVGGEDDDGEVHRSKISQMLGNETKFAVREPIGLRVWILISAVGFTVMALMALVFPNQLYEVVFEEELSTINISVRLYGGALLSLALIMWNGLYTAEKIVIQWTLLSEACYFAVQFLVTSITLMEIGILPNAAMLLLLSRVLFLVVTMAYYYHLGHCSVSQQVSQKTVNLCNQLSAALEKKSKDAAMGKGCIAVTKYFLFLFNLLFFIFGALIMGFGLWVLFDNQSFIAVLRLQMAEMNHQDTVKVASYILIGVGSLSMAMGFFGCIGAIYEIRCLLGLYFTCLLLILIAQVTAGVLIYFQRDRLKYEMSNIIKGMIVNYTGQNRTTEHTWDYIQRTMKCCGWNGPGNWTENIIIKNSTQNLYSCSCRNESRPGTDLKDVGLCLHMSADLPIYEMGCISSVEKWLLDNCGVILGICVGVAVVELLGMILSMCLCKSVVQEDYTKVPKY
ncbi:CD82 antigen Metastasis suppressor Kangai-1-like protein [Larimichthys crocea]|uniref:Tumor protein p53-inducible protein 11 n=1 Tax=Larimichthys crocea TaxID=215358 RepID=A0A6G0IXT9_LARCR|nr:CD82 antigen Metastasis suppressor Kangai-1-like protein [Larimichthys crocea]